MKMKHRTFNIQCRTSKPDARCAAWMLNVPLPVVKSGAEATAAFPFPNGERISKSRRIKAHGFTLIEVLLAVGIFAIVLFAMNTVFFSALKLERATNRAVDARLPLNQALSILRLDLQGAVQPMTNSYLLTRDFKTGGRSGLGSQQGGSLEFYTTTGVISDDAAWGDLQKVRYELVQPTDLANANGQDLVRIVTRNVLATSAEEEVELSLMSGVESVEFLCYNGSDWRSTWDTTAGDVGLPLAVRVRVQLAANDSNVKLSREPLELLVPITTQALTNSLAGGAQ